jgi:hypothetical protein
MPEFGVKEVRLPELHLPEIERDEIVRALSGVHIPQVDLARAKPRKPAVGLGPVMAQWRARGLPPIDPGKLLAAAVAVSRFVRPAPPPSRWSRVRRSRGNLMEIVRPAPRRSRRRLALVTIAVLAVAGWALLRNPASRMRLDRATQKARQWVRDRRAGRADDIVLEVGEPAPVTTEEPAAVTTEEGASTVA